MLILFYTCVPKILMIWNLNRLNLIIRSHFCQFIPFLKTQKIKILKKWKKYWRYHHFTHVYQKPQSYEVRFPRYGVKQTEFFVLLGTFLPFYPSNNPKHQNFEKWNFIHKITIIRSTYDFCASWLIVVTLIQVFKQLLMVVTSLLFWLGLFSLLKVYLH